MTSLLPEQLDDLVNLTYNRNLAKRKWVDISLDNQDYHIADRFIQQKKMPVRGGPQLNWKVQVSNTNSARFTGLFSKDTYDVRNLTIGASQNWAIVTTNYAYDVNESEFQGDDVTLIVDEILVREHAMYNSWFELLEGAFWSAPSSSSQDPRPLSGIPYWIQKNATEGFTGADPSGFSGGAGSIATATYPRWKNYSFPYTAITRDDLVAKWIKATDFCQFRAPHQYPSLDNAGKEPDWVFYTTYPVLEGLHKFLDSRNDNLRDIAGMAGNGIFKGIPVRWVPELTNSTQSGYDSSNPIYGINWRSMQFYFCKGKDMVRTGPVPKDGQHNVRVVHVDSICNLLCKNRRSNFVGYVV